MAGKKAKALSRECGTWLQTAGRGAAPGMVAKVSESSVHEWLVDSGAYKSLVQRCELTDREVRSIYRLAKPMQFQSGIMLRKMSPAWIGNRVRDS